MRRHVRKTFADRFAAHFTPRGIAIWVLATVTVAVAGPFDTFQLMDFGRRLLYWASVVASTVLIANLIRAKVEKRIPDSERVRQRLWAFALASPLITVDVWAISQIPFWSSAERPGFLTFVLFVPPVVFAVSLLHLLLPSESPVDEAPVKSSSKPILAPRLLRRLPGEPNRTVLHLSVRDHLVVVTTDIGTETLRMRFRDALEEMDGIEGFRVHRSHWVARAAIQTVERDQSRLFVQLKNGNRIPVSRNYQPVLKKLGML